MVIFAIGLGAIIALNIYFFLGYPFLASFIFVFALIMGGILFWINSVAENRGKFVERILPDALQLIASNIKAGLTTEKALFASARPEFGPLSQELQNASKKILSGERMEEALMEISRKIKSKMLGRTVWLLSEGIKRGGQISNLLIALSNDLREENMMREEIRANISMYVMLIFFSAAFGAPMLMGISSYIVGVMSEQIAGINVTPEQMAEYTSKSPALSMMGIPEANITEEFIVFFAQIALIVTSVFASMTLGIISGGTEKNGVRYFPVILGVSLVLFTITRIIMGEFMGNMAVFM